ncbi:condensation domain-containing protein [Streptomyces yaizuensis]|uniref:Condensation domain-containing protein n=1 Tax=Streptomyces yaizuensis TaxID=2989713 RepID=A0ABQ5NYR6_9ACTN|nr:condensation domain-containing protein [Streptomyces sp. YSPA8]GLF95303.1 condensation domain-containing protein [Streptomyces sp. YSPA8]
MTASFPLSAAQHTVWSLHTRDASGHRQSSRRVFEVTGPLDPAALRSALDALVQRHEPLRTVYLDGPVQQIRDDLPAGFRLVREPSPPGPFDIARGPLLRVDLRPLDPGRHEITFSLHLLAADGWSMRVFFSDLAALYRAGVRGRAAGLPELSVQYVDWVAWEARRLTARRREQRTAELTEWWRRALAGCPRPAAPDSAPDRAAGPAPGRRLFRVLDATVTGAVRALAAGHGHTAFTVLAAVCALALAGRSGQERVPLGLAVANRDHPQLDRLLGFFVTLSVLPVDLRGDPELRFLLGRVAGTTAAVYEHRDLPLERLTAAAWGPGGPGRPLLPEVVFAHHAAGTVGGLVLDGCETVELPVLDGARFGLTIRVEDTPDGGCRLWAEYDSGRHDGDAVAGLLREYEVLLAAVVARPDSRLSELRALAFRPSGPLP